MRWTPAYDSLFDEESDLGGEPVCRRWAWLELCHLAQRFPFRTRVKGCVIQLERGQLLGPERFLAKRWGWSRSKVARFLAYLASDEVRKIEVVETTFAGCVYAICEYERYALSGGGEGVSAESRARAATRAASVSRDASREPSRDMSQQDAANPGKPSRDASREPSRPSEPQTEPVASHKLKRRDTSSSARGSGQQNPGVNQRRLEQWLGEGMEEAVATLAGDNPELWCRTFIGTWVNESPTGGTDAKARARAGEERWRGAVRDAMATMVLENASYSQRFFRAMVLDRLAGDVERATAVGGDRGRGNPMSVGVLPRGEP